MMSRILTLLLFISLNCNSQVSLHDYYSLRILNDKNLSNVQKSIRNNSFLISKDKDSIDPSILKFLTKLYKKTFQLANPDQPYNATDDVDETLPNRQLRLLFKTKNACFMEYAHGGIGFHYHIAWFELKNNKVTDFWISNSNREVKNIMELKKFIKSFDRSIRLRDGRRITSNRLCF